MKLLFCVIQDSDERALANALIEADFSFTHLSTTGGFLKSGNTTLMIGVESSRLDDVLALIRSKTGKRRSVTASSVHGTLGSEGHADVPFTVTLGGATVFVTDAQMHKF
ncbi:MAG: cyclic-di-AMP receptor [Clostridia bacterium]|nr:cyclic-di-AMP receptor [Clostridia bacterium]